MGSLKLMRLEIKQWSYGLFCLTVPSSEDDVAEYYQQQVEMLEGFNEMDALAERGFIPGMSKVHISHPLFFKVVCFPISIKA